MAEGRAGLREGKGFFDWSTVDAAAYRREVMQRQLALLKQLDMVPAPSDGVPSLGVATAVKPSA